VRDYAEVAGETRVSARSAETALDKLEVDHHGLDEVDRRILATMIERFGGGPVGLSALAHSLGEDKGTLEDLYEPFLLQSGFLQRTPKGRVASALAYRHLGLKPASGPGTLFG
jgi:Holliday junction DNA helicase RuvB